jgi:coenzyme F420-dependent glucose-6-phosphate dehydrogenase
MEIGYALSSEEHRPNALVNWARRAEETGFSFAMISDHFHPWVDAQGQSSFVWSVIGGIAQVTKRLRLGTGVTCPILRIHPAILAQAAATAADMLPGRFFLGVGTGENLNEHILGDHWPPVDLRREMLDEAVEVIRLLWQGGSRSFEGAFYTVENARIYTLPDELPPIMVAAAGPESAGLAGLIGDGLISTSPNAKVVQAFDEMGSGRSRPHYGQMTVCVADNEAEARKTAHRLWPTAGLKGELTAELPLPAHFEQAAQLVTEATVADAVICGADPQRHLEQIQQYVDAGFDHVYVHQIGPDQEAFFRFYEREIIPRLDKAPADGNKARAGRG